jgi:hypothetical protein
MRQRYCRCFLKESPGPIRSYSGRFAAQQPRPAAGNLWPFHSPAAQGIPCQCLPPACPGSFAEAA